MASKYSLLFLCCTVVFLAGCGAPLAVDIPQTPTPGPLYVTITGLVDNPLTLTANNNVDDFRLYGRASTMLCSDGIYETEQATWQGVLLSDPFEAAHMGALGEPDRSN
jgi:DMSO/TMAO reductase YedYZ molybdopterin-dependent catalytic subunit